uniref:E3 ubiquitin-protein ligase n=1 Tax=Macrostomum lignano TaxID=282301 RepID=A0A1I8JAE9_9PLAT
MFSFVVEFSECSLTKSNETHWLALHAFFQYSFPESFICVIRPYKNLESQAKVFMRTKDTNLESLLATTSQFIINGHLTTIIDSYDQTTSATARACILQQPSEMLNFEAIAKDLKTFFGATAYYLNPSGPPSPGLAKLPTVSIVACNDEVLEAALEWLSNYQQQQQNQPVASAASSGIAFQTVASSPPQPAGSAAASAAPVSAPAPAAVRRNRRPLFPEALQAAAAASPGSPAQLESQQPPPPQPQPQPQLPAPQPPSLAAVHHQHQIKDDSADFQLGPSCQLRVDLSDLTSLPANQRADLVIVPSNLKLSLEFGLAKAVASRSQEIAADCRHHVTSLSSGAMPFGDTYLCHRGSRGFRKILFIALPNDRRMERQLGSGDSFRRAMDGCLEQLMSRLARLAVSEGVNRVAMPTLGNNLPLWGGGSHEWAEALATAVVRLVESGALGGASLRLHVCCVARDSLQALIGAVARRLPSEEAPPPANPGAGNSAASWVAEAPLSLASAPPPPDSEVDTDTDEAAVVASEAAESMEVEPNDQQQQSESAPATGDAAEASGTCAICSEDFSADRPAKPFHCDSAGTQLCSECVARMNSSESPTDGKCVLCFQRFRPAVGNQPPNGTMLERVDQRNLPGYDRSNGTIVIKYSFPSGTMEGVQYKGISREAYFPNNEEGRGIVQRLRAAFNGRIVFQVGQSATTGNNMAITWNTLHHKTKINGGPPNHGYPDSGYLSRISDELSALGY